MTNIRQSLLRSSQAPARAAGNNPSRANRHAPFLLLVLCALLSLTGCRLGKPGSASFASVNIKGHSPEQIQEASVKVFQEDGYAAAMGGGGQMIFQKEGTRANNIGQNGVVGTYYGEQTAIRFVAELVHLGGDSFRLQGQAYMVRNPSDSFFADSHPLTNARRMPYQRLLNKVAREVKSMPPPVAAPASPPPATAAPAK